MSRKVLVAVSPTWYSMLMVLLMLASLLPHGAPASAQIDTTAKVARDFGVSETIVKKVSDSDADLAEALRSLPTSLSDAYGALTAHQRFDLDLGLQGSTEILFFTINDKKAFITGSIVGQNVCDEACKSLDKQLAQGKMSQTTHDRMVAVFQAARPLTPKQRGAFMSLMDADAAQLGPAASPSAVTSH